MRLKLDRASLIVGSKFTIFLCCALYLRAIFQVQAPGGIIFGGAIKLRVFCVTGLGKWIHSSKPVVKLSMKRAKSGHQNKIHEIFRCRVDKKKCQHDVHQKKSKPQFIQLGISLLFLMLKSSLVSSSAWIC